MSSKIRKNVIWSVIATIIKNCFTLFTFMVIARLYAPSSMGLISVTLVAYGLAQSLVDSGFTNAVIRQEKTDHHQLSSLYWFCTLLGLLSAVLLIISGTIITFIFHDQEYLRMFTVSALVIFFGSFGQFFFSLLQRQLAFKRVALIEISASIVAFCITVFLALKGVGPVSYFEGTLAGMLVFSFLSFMLVRKFFTPCLRLTISDIKHFFKFGFYNTAEKFIAFISFNLEKPLIANLFGLNALGLYSVVNQIITRPLTFFGIAFSRVAYPLCVKLQHNYSELNKFYIQYLGKLALLIFPIYALIYLFSDAIILILFGQTYLEAKPYVLPLCLMGAIWSISNPFSSYLMALNKAKIGFYLNITSAFLTFFVFLIGSRFDLCTMLWLWVGIQIGILLPVECFIWYHLTKLDTLKFILAILPHIMAVLFLSVITQALVPKYGTDYYLIKTTLAAGTFIIFYILYTFFICKKILLKPGAA